MNTVVTYKANDTAPPLEATLSWQDGATIDLTGATVVFNLRAKSRGVGVVRGPVTVVDASLGKVRYDWQPGDLAEPGEYLAEFEVTLASGHVITVPNGGYLMIRVLPDLG